MWKFVSKFKKRYLKTFKFGGEPTAITKKYASGGTENMNYELKNAFKIYRLEDAPPLTGSISKTEATNIYQEMSSIRKLENTCAQLYQSKEIRGFCHLYIGQEACAVGQHSVLTENDAVITSYRCHGWAHIMGLSHEALFSELTGKKGGCSRGKGGSMHIYVKNFYGGNGIVGAQTPLGTGIALALKYMNKNAVCLILYGDGASNQGQIFESYNMACLWNLPAIFICENNLYGMGTSVDRSSCNTDYFTRGDAIPGIWVDGMNVLAVRNATAFAREYAINNGPILMELYTYRYHGHSMSDPGTSYRTREEVQQMRKSRDPLTLFRQICVDGGLITEAEFDKIDDDLKKQVDAALKKAQADKEIELKELAGDVYYTSVEPKIRGINGWTFYDHQNVTKRTPYTPKPTSKDKMQNVKKEDKKAKGSKTPSSVPKPNPSKGGATSPKATESNPITMASSADPNCAPKDSGCYAEDKQFEKFGDIFPPPTKLNPERDNESCFDE